MAVSCLIDLRQLFRFGDLQRGVEGFAPRVGGENRVQETRGCSRVLLIDRADAGAFRQQDFATERHEIANDQLEQRRFANPVASDQAYFRARRNCHACRIEKAPAPGIKDKILDPKHIAGAKTAGMVGRGGSLPQRASDSEWKCLALDAIAEVLDCFAEPVIGPAASGRTRWLAMATAD